MFYEGDNMMTVKRTNRSAALRILHEQGGMSRKRLAETIRLTPAAITKIVAEMIDDGLVREGRTLSAGSVGRREVLVELDPRARCALGILINLRKATVSAVWMDGSVIFSEEIELPPAAPADPTVEALCRRLLDLAAAHQLEHCRILGVGIAVRGITAPDDRTVVNSFGALDRRDYPLADRVTARTGLPAVMRNNVRALFQAQMFFARDCDVKSQFFLRCEYGIGASFAIDEEIWRGDTQQCAEIGHIPVVRRGGKPCVCGKSGCLETIASPSAIREEAHSILSPEQTPVLWAALRDRDPETLTVQDVLEAARNGDGGAGAIVDRAVEALAQALKSVIYLIDPGKIVLYGHLFDNSYYLARFMAEMREGVDAGHNVTIERSRYNGKLEPAASGLLMIREFFNLGGIL